MKKVIAAALSILLIVGIMPVALAEDIAPVRVSTLAELQKAIADAESGDTICVTQTIIVSGNIQVGEEGKWIPTTMRICACSWNNGKRCVRICAATTVLLQHYIAGKSRPLRTMLELPWNVWNRKNLTRTSAWLVAGLILKRSLALRSN